MEEPRLRLAGNRGEDGAVFIAVIADDEAGGGEDFGGSLLQLLQIAEYE